MRHYVVYYRVSTKDQGRSGLGLEAQERDVGLFLERFSEEPWEVIATFTEVESGADDRRPVMAEALAMVRKTGSELLVAKLDRLSRNVAFTATLMDDPKVKLRVAAMPSADKFHLHVYAALAEQERRFISERTKAAMAAVKARNAQEPDPAKRKQIGGLRPNTEARNIALQAVAKANAERVGEIVLPLHRQGASLRAIAGALNSAGVETARGGQWAPSQVQRVLMRLGA